MLAGVAPLVAAGPVPAAPWVDPPGGVASRDLDGDGVVRVAAVGDSILEGAATGIRAAFSEHGIEAVVDTAVNRSTLVGADHVRMHGAAGVDAVVVMLGANDAVDVATFRSRVAAVTRAASGAPLLFWMTIPEVRDYYPDANAVLREVVPQHPGGTVLEWSPVSAGGGVTAGDGLHLSASGASTMVGFVVASVVSGLDARARTVATPAARGAASDPTAGGPRLGAGSGGGEPDGGEPGSGPSVRGVRASATESIDSALGGVGWAATLVAAGLVASGLGLALWSLWSTRPRREQPVHA